MYKAKDSIIDFIKTHIPVLYNLFGTFMEFYDDFMRFTYLWSAPQALVYMVQTIITTLIQDPLGFISGYGGEKGADSMAARYGYGPDLISALTKCEEMENSVYTQTVKNTGIIGQLWSDITMVELDCMQLLSMDPQPTNNKRCKATLDKLKRDLKNGDYPTPMKKDLQTEINRLEKMYETIDKNPQIKDSKVRETFWQIVDAVTADNRDFREALNGFYYNKYQF